jgi:hypothetical protein
MNETTVTWTISYTSDLCKNVVKSMQQKRLEVLAAIEKPIAKI